ncbi:FAD-dependent oxidoreductase [Aureimonas endophytica]|uniref:FAD-dependent oxidoreductase n=1 Tax=Aureimonas endophytica TaxID=2027858 RepID=A0A917E5N5_9HYPH|nr:NAD(P)/FAD-dependent oxidoreductase [Aureimonas endophytica]GGE05454.1 FAD-dependent oxidoreductase [Aureimonas endophytica]
MRRFDAIVIGGGPAGASTATLLAQRGWQVAVIEKAIFPRRKVCGEFLSATSIGVLDQLGIGPIWRQEAGPAVRRLALFAGADVVEAPVPATAGIFGRALGRDRLDMILLSAATRAGVEIFQPCRAVAIEPDGTGQRVRVMAENGEQTLWAQVIIGAHGSWDVGPLPTHLPKSNRPSDHFGFKAYFRDAIMKPDLMPLLVFPGGYGGIVWADRERLSVSCCLRRDMLSRIRAEFGARTIAEAVHRHLLASCRGLREAVGEAALDGGWLSVGPIRPGIRPKWSDDIFRVGNCAGESHPIVAEGISMAIQSAWLLDRALADVDAGTPAGRAAAGRRYADAWRRQFAGRIRAADLFARLGADRTLAAIAAAGIRLAPRLLTFGAALAGKTTPLRLGSPPPTG